MKNLIKSLFLALIAVSLFTACKKVPDSPPVDTIKDGSTLTIDSLKNWQNSVGEAILITDSLSVFGIVTMDESNGNIYKNIYFQDHTGAINVRFTSSTDLIQGDSIRIALIGVTLNNFNGVYQLDGVDEEKNVIVQSNGNDLTPLVISLADIDSSHQSMLVQFDNVQFKNSELTNTYANAITQSAQNRLFEDGDGNVSYIRTSGFSDFAGDSLPQGNGSMVCIVSEYNEEIQYILRSPEEALLTGTRGPGEFLVKDFNDEDISSGGWIVQQIVGTLTWNTATIGGWEDRPYGVISNYDGANFETESWFISPNLDFSSSVAAAMSFDNAYNYSGDPLELLISTDYTGTGDPNASTWVSLTAIWSTGGFEFVNSGMIDLGAYLVNGVRIAFKYTGGAASGSTWEIDNIIINA